MTRGLLVLFLAGLLAGCGYHRPGRGDNLGDVHTLYVALFANKTYQPFVENELTNAVTRRFLRTQRWRLVEDAAAADAVFSGTVFDYRSVPVSFDRNDNILEYRSQISVKASLRRTQDGRILWKGDANWSEEYSGGLDKGLQNDLEQVAIRSSAERLADELFYRLTENF